VLHHNKVKADNSGDEPNIVIPAVHQDYVSEFGKLPVLLPALSWNVVRFSEIPKVLCRQANQLATPEKPVSQITNRATTVQKI
jgi:hypothetical protein